jgi:hypothetical protein
VASPDASFASLLDEWLTKHGRGSAKRLADEVGTSDTTISRWRWGTNDPGSKWWPGLARALGLTVNEVQELATGETQSRGTDLEERMLMLIERTAVALEQIARRCAS